MKLREITQFLESLAPLAYQESYDNSGLLVGDPNQEIHQALISLDCTEEVVDEAISIGANLIISHHPIVFSGIKKLTGKNYVERVLLKAIKNDIALYAIHTNLDSMLGGVNSKIAEKLGLQHTAILKPKTNSLEKLCVYVPVASADKVRNALYQAGAGKMSLYDECSFNTSGYGTFRPLEGADPFLGNVGEQHREMETKIEVLYPKHLRRSVLLGLFESHPYEFPAYDLIALENSDYDAGSGLVGELPDEMSQEEFLAHVKNSMDVSVIRFTPLTHKSIKRVALCGGSGSFLLKDAIQSGADAYISADFKYHEFFDAENKLLIADIGHFESEQFTQQLLLEVIQKKFTTFAIRLTGIVTNPINYYS